MRRGQEGFELVARRAKRGGAADDPEAPVAAQCVDDPVAVQADAYEDEDVDIRPQQRTPGIHGEIHLPPGLVAWRDLSRPEGDLSTRYDVDVRRPARGPIVSLN